MIWRFCRNGKSKTMVCSVLCSAANASSKVHVTIFSDLYSGLYIQILFVLESYLSASHNFGVAILNTDCKETMNDTFSAIVSSETEYSRETCECVFLSSLRIHCTQTLPGTKNYFRANTSGFFDWLGEFLSVNKLHLPYAENLFFTLMVCLLASQINLLEFPSTNSIIELLVKRLRMSGANLERVMDICEKEERCNEMCFVNKSRELESCPCFCCESYHC
eukprot:TRINITY_DN2095_c0_g1_i8.p1 TRINITY_DN2095_c0_g1~~TRINITY_DN2095_c0_g1_i8.p1  ORF type:complete len:220 (-),score=25.63 TRINITY_DN2095_c0_g1_i8:109-768(-)